MVFMILVHASMLWGEDETLSAVAAIIDFAGTPICAPVFMICLGAVWVFTRHATAGDLCRRGLARQARELRAGSSKDEALTLFLTKREAWAKRAKQTTEFQRVSIQGGTATVTTLDRGTPGKLETSVYTLRRTAAGWKLQQERSTQQPTPAAAGV